MHDDPFTIILKGSQENPGADLVRVIKFLMYKTPIKWRHKLGSYILSTTQLWNECVQPDEIFHRLNGVPLLKVVTAAQAATRRKLKTGSAGFLHLHRTTSSCYIGAKPSLEKNTTPHMKSFICCHLRLKEVFVSTGESRPDIPVSWPGDRQVPGINQNSIKPCCAAIWKLYCSFP